MWRAYTREKPARQGLAIIIVAIASASVAAFAGAVVSYKATPILSDENRAPDDWPISFKMAPDYEVTTAVRASQIDTGLVSLNRRIIFKSKSDARRRIGIGHRKASESNEVMDAVMAVAERAASDPGETLEAIGLPVADPEWQFLRKTRSDSVTYLATLMHGRTIVRIAFVTPSTNSKDLRVLAAICNSVQLRDERAPTEETD